MAVETKAQAPTVRASVTNAAVSNGGSRPAVSVCEASGRRSSRVERMHVRVVEHTRRDQGEWAWLSAVAVFTVLMGVLLGLFGGGGDVRLEPAGEVQVSEERGGTLWTADR